MFFKDLVIIYDSNIFEYSEYPEFFESLPLEPDIDDVTSDVNVLSTKGYIKYVLIFEHRTLCGVRKLGLINYFSQLKMSCAIKNGFYPGTIPTCSQTTCYVF